MRVESARSGSIGGRQWAIAENTAGRILEEHRAAAVGPVVPEDRKLQYQRKRSCPRRIHRDGASSAIAVSSLRGTLMPHTVMPFVTDTNCKACLARTAPTHKAATER